MVRLSILSLLLAVPALAVDRTQLARSVVQIQTRDRDGYNSLGTGVYVGGQWVLTAGHVCRDARTVDVVYANGQRRVRAKYFLNNAHDDQRLLELVEPLPLPAARLATSDPRPGEPCYVAGISFGRSFDVVSTIVQSIGAYRTADTGSPVAVYRTSAVSGDSGGPVFNARGELIGNLWGGIQNETHGVSNATTRAFVRRCAAQYPAVQGASGLYYGMPATPATCPPSGCPQPQQQPLPIYPNPGETNPCPPGSCKVEIDVDALIAKMAESGKFQGPPGQEGRPGKDGQPGAPGTVGPPGAPGSVSLEEIRQIVREELNNLPPAYLQPSYYDAAGNLRPEGSPIEIRLGQESALPPVALEVIGTNGRRSLTQGSNGGTMSFKMADLVK